MTALLFILGGFVVCLSTLWWFAKIRGGWFSLAGLIAIVLIGLGVALVLIGFGVLPMPVVQP